MTEKYCGSCKFWIKRPADPMNLTAAIGECRCSPPIMIALPTQQGIQISPLYPVLPPEYPSCSHHQSRIEE